MFSVRQKREIAGKIQEVLQDTGHPELPLGEIHFRLYVDGATPAYSAVIHNNGAVLNPSVNPHNEVQDPIGVAKGATCATVKASDNLSPEDLFLRSTLIPVEIPFEQSCAGIELRDRFAGQALNGLLSDDYGVPESMAAVAYEFADAMMAARVPLEKP